MFIDYSKYKRFFTFGCSFTHNIWPTWANILASEMPNAEFYNLGKSGSGNQLISYRVAEANVKYQFNSEDLIIVMFSTFYREDRYVGPGWLSRGNIFNNSVYGEDFLKNFADPIGYMIRDLALIELVKTYLNSLSCKSILLLACDSQEESVGWSRYSFQNNISNTEVLSTYEHLIKSFPPSLKEVVGEKSGTWKIGHSYIWEGREHNDSHPNPEMYYNYLKHLNFNLTDKAYNYTQESMTKLKLIKERSDHKIIFPTLNFYPKNSKKFLF